MYRIFSVLVKPKYSVEHVIRLYNQCKKHCTKDFEFILITDRDLDLPGIKSYNFSKYDLETWWNKLLIFHPTFFSEHTNIYFDLDTDIRKNFDDMFDQIQDNILVVDAWWKNEKYFRQSVKLQNPEAFLSKGNTSVMGWKGDKTWLWHFFEKDIDTHVTKHFGDDTFINKYGNVDYFKNNITLSYAANKDTKIAINHKEIFAP